MVIAAVFLAGCAGDRSARQQLRNDFMEAHHAADADALMALYVLDGVRPKDISLLRMAAEAEVKLPLDSVSFERPGPEDHIEFESDGVRFEATLPIRWLMVVRYHTEDRLTAAYPVGIRDGRAYLVTARPHG